MASNCGTIELGNTMGKFDLIFTFVTNELAYMNLNILFL